MLEKMHQLMLDELQQTARTDTLYSTVAIVLNLLVLGIGSAIADDLDGGDGFASWLVFLVFMGLVAVSSLVTLGTLRRGHSIRQRLLGGLMKMYQDQGLYNYYDPQILQDAGERYRYYTVFVQATAVVAVLVPMLVALS